jgi:hypothetical protein
MRERAFSFRGRTGAGAGFLERHRETWLLAMGGALLMAGVGAFGTDRARLPVLYSYWFGLMGAGGLLGALALEWTESLPLCRQRSIARGALLVALVAPPMTVVVWIAAALAMNSSWHPSRMFHLLPQVLLVLGPFVVLQLVLQSRRAKAPAAVPPLEGDFRKRLPKPLRGATLLALEAEDHYLRVHTDAGSALLLMKLGEAAAELGPGAGAQTHRSWWVAGEAVESASRGGGRATLSLKGGLMVPVSRTYAPALRAARWF